ncbi:glycosyltransferase family 1 protein, partial [Bacillus vallismortis]|nr:glycosyltransferase family 1 protein [Bacillus vallismortis]
MTSSPKRVLHVLSGMNRGGAETMVLNLYRKMDRSKVQFDFLTYRN